MSFKPFTEANKLERIVTQLKVLNQKISKKLEMNLRGKFLDGFLLL